MRAPARRSAPSALPAVVTVLVLLTGCGPGAEARGTDDSGESIEAPAVSPFTGGSHAAEGPPASDTVEEASAEDFVGAGTCGSCHREQHEAWSASTHGNAGGPPNAETVIAPFDGTPIRFRDALVTPTVTEAGEYEFTVEWDGHGTRRLAVDGVVGRGHMLGGGTQGFLRREPDGTFRFLPFDYSRTEERWFCNTIGRADRGWVPITPDLRLAECTDWPPQRVFGNVRRFDNCQECHGSGIRVETRRGSPHYRTEFESLRVDCESCHGPGRRHVELARSGEIETRADIGLPALDLMDEEASLQVCFRCHALKTPLEPDYLPGRPFREHYALDLPILGEEPYLPDGRVRTFVYQETHLSSECYLRGSMTCVDCHAPHSQEYRDVNGRPLSGPFDDGQCLACHGSKAEAPERHTRHPPDSPGSRCVACHMPYLQQAEVGERIRYARSDHSIPVPRPAFDSAQGLVTACRSCHEDRAIGRLQSDVEAWWGPVRPQDPLVRGILDAEGIEDLSRAGELLLRPDRRNPVAQLTALNRLLERHLRPDMPDLPAEVRDRLERLAGSDDAEQRAVALAALHYAGGDDPGIRRFVDSRMPEAGEDPSGVRARWALALGFLADRHREAGEIAAAVSTYRKALELAPRDAGIHLALGRAHAAGGDAGSAIRAYRRSLEIDPVRALPHVSLGIVYAATGREREAMREYEAALEIDPREVLAHFNLGNLHLRADRPSRAIEAYRRAAEIDPGLAPAHFNLARAYIMEGEYRRALASVRLGLEFEPGNATGGEMLRDLQRVLEGR